MYDVILKCPLDLNAQVYFLKSLWNVKIISQNNVLIRSMKVLDHIQLLETHSLDNLRNFCIHCTDQADVYSCWLG